MAHARRAEPATSQSAIYIYLAVVAGALLAVTAVFSGLDPLGLRPSADPHRISPAVLESGRQWELERLQQGGYIDPVVDSGRNWEEQRRQQGGYMDPLLQAGRDWEEQRRQQNAD